MKPIRHLFWDFDGTLYDSYPNVTHAFLRTLDELGCSGLVTPHEALSLLKVSVFSAAQHCAGMAGLDVARVMEVFAHYHAQESGFTPYTGLGDCLRALQAAGVRHYLYTHRDRRAIEQLEQDGLWSLFSDGVTSELDDDVIVEALGRPEAAQDVAEHLTALALSAGGRDNITCVVVDALPTGDPADDHDETRPRPR